MALGTAVQDSGLNGYGDGGGDLCGVVGGTGGVGTHDWDWSWLGLGGGCARVPRHATKQSAGPSWRVESRGLLGFSWEALSTHPGIPLLFFQQGRPFGHPGTKAARLRSKSAARRELQSGRGQLPRWSATRAPQLSELLYMLPQRLHLLLYSGVVAPREA